MRLRIAFVGAAFDPADVGSWSGTPHHVYTALRDLGAEVIPLGPCRLPFALLLRSSWRVRRTAGRKILPELEPGVARSWGRQVSDAIEDMEVDAVLSLGSVPFGAWPVNAPLVLWPDAAFGSLVDWYPAYTGLSRAAIRRGNAMDGRALKAASHVMFSSEWARSEAIRRYGVRDERTSVVHYGANLSPVPALERSGRCEAGACRLLFAGVEWQRKGGDRAVRLAQEMARQGARVTLTIAGVKPPSGTDLDGIDVRVVGFIDKHTAIGRSQLIEEYRQSDFFVLPSRADCTPLVLAEAMAMGVPPVVTAVGGMTELLGPTGIVLDEDGDLREVGSRMLRLLSDTPAYDEMRRQVRARYETELNWETAGSRALQVLQGVCRG